MSHLFKHCVVDGKCEIDHYPIYESSVGGCQATKDMQCIEAAVIACCIVTDTITFDKTSRQPIQEMHSTLIAYSFHNIANNDALMCFFFTTVCRRVEEFFKRV